MEAKKVRFRGKRFASLKELAAHYDAHYGNLVRRLNADWSTSQALGLSPAPGRSAHNAIRLIASIGTFPSARDAAKATSDLPPSDRSNPSIRVQQR